MKSEAKPHLQPQSRERNKKIASVLTLIITVSAKIERLKQKLCGFSSKEFSPQCVFQALDLTGKGYLDLYDFRQFLSNNNIHDQDIIRLFLRYGGTKVHPRLTYLGYLNIIKPYFAVELARDLLLRDTVTKNLSSEERVRETQEAVLLLINELILLNCICIAEHEEMKTALMEQYMLNQMELVEILGLEQGAPLRVIYEFIDCHSDFQVQEGEVKFLLSYLQAREFQLSEEQVIADLFVPLRLQMDQIFNQKQGTHRSDHFTKEKERIHTNYDKKYIGKQDLSLSTQKLSFLNYIHPNSYQHQIMAARDGHEGRKEPMSRGEIGTEHEGLEVYNDKKMKRSFQQLKRVGLQTAEDEKLDESNFQPSNVYGSRGPVKLISASQVPLNTPVLEQFMHERNIKRNMGQDSHYSHHNQLNVLLQESHLSESQAFVRLPRGPQNYLNSKNSNIKESREKEIRPVKMVKQPMKPEWLEKRRMEVSSKMGVSMGPNILDQFIKGDLL